MYETILVAIDGSESSRRALSHAIRVGKRDDATLHVLTVVETRANPMKFGVLEVDELNRSLSGMVEDILEEYDDAGIEIVGEVRRGNPADVVLNYAEEIDADLLVVGQRGADSIETTILGSTADRLARSTTIPLVIVPGGDDGRE